MPDDRTVLDELAGLLDEIGPALIPVGFKELLTSITETARSLFGAEACSLALVDPDGAHLTFEVASGRGAEEVIGLKVEAGKGIAGWVAMSGQPITIGDVASDTRFEASVAEDTGYVPRSIVAMPLETARETVGVIEVLDPDTETRDGSRDMEILARFADQAALAIESGRAFTELGTALLRSAASATDGDLSAALTSAADERSGTTGRLLGLVGQLQLLNARGDKEIAAATEILTAVNRYADSSKRHR